MSKILKDPLLHFLLLGGALFVLLAAREDTPEPARIHITADEVERLARGQLVLDPRDMQSRTIDALVEAYVRDEIYYREALALGLDVDDDQVRTRLIEKMRYVTENLADPEPASEGELRAFFDANPELFLQPATVTFDHVFFSPSQRGARLRDDIAAGLERLRAGAPAQEVGDRTPLGDRFEAAPGERVHVLFGESLTGAVFDAPLGQWIGPFESDFGQHVVRVHERNAARQPSFDEAGERALEIFAAEERRAHNEAAFEEMRARYDVVVEWPSAPEAAP